MPKRSASSPSSVGKRIYYNSHNYLEGKYISSLFNKHESNSIVVLELLIPLFHLHCESIKFLSCNYSIENIFFKILIFKIIKIIKSDFNLSLKVRKG